MRKRKRDREERKMWLGNTIEITRFTYCLRTIAYTLYIQSTDTVQFFFFFLLNWTDEWYEKRQLCMIIVCCSHSTNKSNQFFFYFPFGNGNGKCRIYIYLYNWRKSICNRARVRIKWPAFMAFAWPLAVDWAATTIVLLAFNGVCHLLLAVHLIVQFELLTCCVSVYVTCAALHIH